jgi:hypothetical protein
VSSQDYILKLETDHKRMSLDLKAYREYLTGIHENLILDNDRLTEKKAREIKQSGHNMHKEDLLRQKIEELEHCVETFNTFKYTLPLPKTEQPPEVLDIHLFDSPRSPIVLTSESEY